MRRSSRAVAKQPGARPAGNSARPWLHVCALLTAAAVLRLGYLGYSTFYHGEAEFAEVIAYVLPCLKRLSFPEALWRQWHLFVLHGNPWY